MINDTSQRSVAMLFGRGGKFDIYFITDLLLSMFWKNFSNSWTFAKLWGKSWLPRVLCASGHWPGER